MGSEIPDEINTEMRKTVFAWYGAAAYSSQLFEVELIILLGQLNRWKNPRISVEKMDEFDINLSKKPLGRLLSKVCNLLKLSTKLSNLLEDTLTKRNYLIHHFFFKNADKLFSYSGCKLMIEELEDLEASFQKANKSAEMISKDIRKRMGISEKDLQTLVEEEVEKFYNAYN